jgi:hypothetical protein
MSGLGGGLNLASLPLHVDANGDLIYTNPSGVTQILAPSAEFPSYRDYHFQSFSGSSGTNWAAGFYELVAADLNLTQAAATGTVGAANVPYGAHAILVASGAGAASGGATGTADITISGTSVTEAGVRTTSDTEVLVADVTAMSANEYFESTKLWIGQVTYTIAATGDHTTFSADFNVGLVNYEKWGDQDVVLTGFEASGLGCFLQSHTN